MSKVVKKVTQSVGGLLGMNEPEMPKIEPAPVVEEKKPMPTADEESLKKARRRAASTRRGGRASTILSSGMGSNDKLGG